MGAMGKTGWVIVACLLVKKCSFDGGCFVVPRAALRANKSKIPGFLTLISSAISFNGKEMTDGNFTPGWYSPDNARA